MCSSAARVFQVLKFIQMIAQARQTAKRISDHSVEAAANTSFLSWFGMGSGDPGHTYGGSELDEGGENVKKTHEFLDRALENLCQIFKVCCLGPAGGRRSQIKRASTLSIRKRPSTHRMRSLLFVSILIVAS